MLAKALRKNPVGPRFADLMHLAKAAGFVLRRTKGSHHQLSRRGTQELMTFQPDGAKAKPYQVRQLLDVIEKYDIQIP